ncbi:MAG: DinB family protein [Candidatus Acidiferrales bacterium]
MSAKESTEQALREQVAKLLDWGEAHAEWKESVEKFPEKDRGRRPEGAPHSAWELLEHARIAQWDILEFSRDAKHKSLKWPDDYWPKSAEPTSDAAWQESVKQFEADRRAMQKLVKDPETDLFAAIRHGKGQTILREALLLADHNAYHLGQLVLVRRMLGDWKKG